jgi:hypothetical protein
VNAIGHAKIKGLIYFALRTQIRDRHLPCHVLVEGPTVRIDEKAAYEPDATVYCGEELPLTGSNSQTRV